jgi:hypothetical protein
MRSFKCAIMLFSLAVSVAGAQVLEQQKSVKPALPVVPAVGGNWITKQSVKPALSAPPVNVPEKRHPVARPVTPAIPLRVVKWKVLA